MTGSSVKRGILSVGRLYSDLIFTDLPRLPTMGTEIYAGRVGLHTGGGAFITAAHVAALGRPSSLAAMLPAPPFLASATSELEAAGIDTDLCAVSDPADDPQLTVALVGNVDRAFVTRRTGPAFPRFTTAALADRDVCHIHIGELATLVECPDIVDIARAAGLSISLDCGWDETLCAEQIGGLIGQVDVFLPNEDEVAHLRALNVDMTARNVTVTKSGAAGAMARVGDRSYSAPAQEVRVVDTTGAGDAFNAGFLDAWLSGTETGCCLIAGNARAACAIAQPGGFVPNDVSRDPTERA